MELSKLGIKSIIILADSISSHPAVNFEALERVSHQEHTTSPGVIKTAVLVAGILGIIGLVEIVRAVKRFVVQNA